MKPERALSTGEKIGFWTVLSCLDNDRYLCRCVCGNEREVRSCYILSGVINSCGCKYNRTIDLTGKKFGRLTAMEPIPERSADINVQWLCQCDCGNRKVFKAALLTSGRRKSCGCIGVRTDGLMTSRTLVEGTCVEYMFSDHTPKNNTSGCKGVNLDRGKWRASITYGGKTKWLGTFDSFEDAVRVRKQAETEVREHLRVVIKEQGVEISEERLQRNLKDKPNDKPSGTSKNNKSGYIGVFRYGKKWRAYLSRDRKTHWLGTFATLEEAVEARRVAEDEYNENLRNKKEIIKRDNPAKEISKTSTRQAMGA